MYRQLFHASPLMLLPLGALFLFVVVFLAVVVRAWRSAPAEVGRAARLPLEEDPHG